MEMYEVDSLLDNYYLKNKDSWEQARFIAYMTAQVNSSKTLSPKGIMKFHWEDEDKPTVIDEDEIRRLELEIKQLEDILNNNE